MFQDRVAGYALEVAASSGAQLADTLAAVIQREAKAARAQVTPSVTPLLLLDLPPLFRKQEIQVG